MDVTSLRFQRTYAPEIGLAPVILRENANGKVLDQREVGSDGTGHLEVRRIGSHTEDGYFAPNRAATKRGVALGKRNSTDASISSVLV